MKLPPSAVLLSALTALAACSPRAGRMESLMDAGLYGAARNAARENPEAAEKARVFERISEALALTVAMEPIPIEAFGVPPRGYGEDWLLVGVGQTHAPGIAANVMLHIELDGWSICSECGDAFIREKMAVPPPEGEEPSSTTRKSGGSYASAGGGLRALGRSLGELGRVIGGAIFLPISLVVETAFLPLSAQKNDNWRPYGATELIWDLTWGHTPTSGSGSGLGSTVPVAPAALDVSSGIPMDEGLLCIGDRPCSAMIVLRGGGELPTMVNVDADILLLDSWERIEGSAEWPISEADTLAEAVTAAFPTEGRPVPLELR